MGVKRRQLQRSAMQRKKLHRVLHKQFRPVFLCTFPDRLASILDIPEVEIEYGFSLSERVLSRNKMNRL